MDYFRKVKIYIYNYTTWVKKNFHRQRLEKPDLQFESEVPDEGLSTEAALADSGDAG